MKKLIFLLFLTVSTTGSFAQEISSPESDTAETNSFLEKVKNAGFKEIERKAS